MLNRTWSDPRDGVEWKVEAVPVMERLAPGRVIPMIGPGTRYQVWFRSDRDTYLTAADFRVMSRLDELTDDRLGTLLDQARRARSRLRSTPAEKGRD